MWKYLYIFDYCQCGIYKIDVPNTEEDIDVEQLLAEHGLNIDTCSYMFSDDELCIEFIEKIH